MTKNFKTFSVICILVKYSTTSGDFFLLLTIFTDSLDPNQDRQNVRLDLNPN